PQPIPHETLPTSTTNGVVETLEDAVKEYTPTPQPSEEGRNGTSNAEPDDEVDYEDDDGEEEDEDDDEDDIEIIMEPVSRSLDLRNQNRPPTGSTPRVPSASTPSKGILIKISTISYLTNITLAPQPSLTTEYTPMSRGGPPQPSTSTPSQVPQQESSTSAPSHQQPPPIARYAGGEVPPQPDDGVDTSTLPPATAPPSHPPVDPSAVGIFDGRAILEVDLDALADKPWRRPGSDISDWFNYGFDEISWEAYCYRRRDIGELAHILKNNVVNFAGMTDDQLVALPPDTRTMVMTGANAMMNNAAGNAGMMVPNMMMDMGMMNAMGMMNGGDMGMPNPMMQNMMGEGQPGVVPTTGTTDQVGMMPDGFNPAAGPGGMLNMGMGGDFGMPDQGGMVPQMYPVMEQTNVGGVSSGRGTPIPFRGSSRGAPPGRGSRGGFVRGRGRGGGMYIADAPAVTPARPASPLPPNVPTGPRNQNKYKDRDGNAPAVDGLDYGGGKDGGMGRRTPSGEPEERISSRKRRSSPSMDDIRGSKRR
ncbi:hypothetical protein CVT24_005321, partial [Panaeolus cyanescens]